MLIDIIQLIDANKAWFLTVMSSLMCVMGATIIFLDVIVKWVHPSSRFSIRSNDQFLISGFSLSCGSLLLTSLYRLLPKSFHYFSVAYKRKAKQHSDPSNDGPVERYFFNAGPNTETMLSFMAGIIVCYALNEIIHYATSESIVHCAHGDEEADDSKDHSHAHSHAHSHSHSDSHSHSHSHSHSSTSGLDDEDDLKHTHVHNHNHDHYDIDPLDTLSQSYGHDEESRIENRSPQHATETTPLVSSTDNHNNTPITAYVAVANTDQAIVMPIVPRKSIMGMIDKLTHPQSQQVCQGIFDTNCDGFPCVNEQLTDRVSNDIHNLDFYRGLSLKRTKSSLVAYTTDANGSATTKSHSNDPSATSASASASAAAAAAAANALSSTSTAASISAFDTPAQPYIMSSVITNLPSNIRLATEPNLDLHAQHTDDHHHQVTTPVSRLLSIGLQTCLALTLHKFPEGFITYATTRADPELGLSIFLSLAIHNIVEGFSMALPLYLALNSRWKAFGITFFLGGLSQPIGALAATFLLDGRKLDKNESSGVFGVLMAVTAGFLTVISLQLFASAINFGGSTTSVIRWSVAGMFIIMLSSTLTDFTS